MSPKQKIKLFRIIAAIILTIIIAFLPIKGFMLFVLYLIPYLISGYDILQKAIKGIINRQAFDENLLMAVATVGALGLALYTGNDYTEAVAVMIFYQIGELFESYAVNKSRKNISELMDIKPDFAWITDANGNLSKVDPDEVEIGTIITVKPGERIPIDGVVVEGNSTINTAALTGESLPQDVHQGSDVNSGCINQNGIIKIKTNKRFEDSTASKILELIEDASTRKSKSENFISKFARVYTPAVVYSAIALAILPPLCLILAGSAPEWNTWVYRAFTFLVISCPCALVISIPLSFFAGIGGASREGILIKGSNFMETLAQTDTVVFDKTGTLTKGTFEVTTVHPDKLDKEELLKLAASVEKYSNHPVALSIVKAACNVDKYDIEDVEEIAGHGIVCKVNNKTVYVGNQKLMEKAGAKWRPCHHTGTIIHIAIDGEYEGHIVISDVIKENSEAAITALKAHGIKRAVMLTGDATKVAEHVASQLKLDKYHAELLPQDKVAQVEALLKQEKAGKKLAFVGDGINDAPVLSRADLGIAMGAMGSDAAIEAADVVLMDDNPAKIAVGINIARKCLTIVKENIWFSIGIKVICLILGALGLAGMWLAIFADVGVMILAVLNAIRCLFTKKIRENILGK